MAQPSDLTTLATVLDWLDVTADSPSGRIARLITACSGSIMAYLQRDSFLSRTCTDLYDGRDQRALYFNAWPVTAVQSLSVDGQAIPQSPDGVESGWVLQPWNGYPPGSPQSIKLIEYCFNRGQLNIQATYTAGYLTNEVWTPAASVTPIQGLGRWVEDGGVTYVASGTALTKVPSAPAVGQYAVSGVGVYTFSAAETLQVSLAYSFVPSTIEDACINFVSHRYRARAWIGQKTESIGSQTSVSHDLSDIPAAIKLQLSPFRKILPV